MRVEVRLYASLSPFAPSRTAGIPFQVEIEGGSPVSHLIEQIGIPSADVHLCIVNGRLVHDRCCTHLKEGDRIGFFPPVGGG